MFIVNLADHDGNIRCLIEKNVPIGSVDFAQYIESRDGDHNGCLCSKITYFKGFQSFETKQ